MGLVVPQHVGSSWTRDQSCVLCIGRQILYHSATREVPQVQFWFIPESWRKAGYTHPHQRLYFPLFQALWGLFKKMYLVTSVLSCSIGGSLLPHVGSFCWGLSCFEAHGNLVPCPGSNFVPHIPRWIPNHWATREVPFRDLVLPDLLNHKSHSAKLFIEGPLRIRSFSG